MQLIGACIKRRMSGLRYRAEPHQKYVLDSGKHTTYNFVLRPRYSNFCTHLPESLKENFYGNRVKRRSRRYSTKPENWVINSTVRAPIVQHNSKPFPSKKSKASSRFLIHNLSVYCTDSKYFACCRLHPLDIWFLG